VTVITQPSKNTPGVLGAANASLGALCKAYAENCRDRRHEIFNYLDKQLTLQLTSKTRQLEAPVVEGCVRGLNDYLAAFGLPDDEEEVKEGVYDKMNKLCRHPTDDGSRRGYRRAAVELVADHAALFGRLLAGEINVWYPLLKEWAFSRNRDDHKIGWRAMLALFKTTGDHLGDNESSFNYLLARHRETISSPVSTAKEVSLAVQGYGHLATACAKLKGQADVNVMLAQVLNNAHKVFLSPSADQREGFGRDDVALHMPSYLEALTCVLAHAESVPANAAFDVERLMVHAVATFPRLPEQYHGFSVGAVRNALDVCCRRLPPASINNVVYQGIVRSCSYPIVTKRDEDLLQALPNLVSVESFVPFWKRLLSSGDENELRKVLFGLTMSSALQILTALDFSLTKKNDEVDDLTDPEAVKVKDFTVGANLVKLCQSVMFVNVELLEDWFDSIVAAVKRVTAKFPHVSSFYALLSGAIQSVEKSGFFEKRFLDLQPLRTLLAESLTRCGSFDHAELRTACLEMCLSVPSNVVAVSILPLYCHPLETVFRQGGRNLNLANKAINFLKKLNGQYANEDGMKNLLERLLPIMKAFLSVGASGVATEAEQSQALSRSKRKGKKKKNFSSSYEESEIEKTQRSLLLFLGTLDMDVLQGLIPNKEEIGKSLAAVNVTRSLSFIVPFPDVNVDIFLDDLVPRILHLCSKSQDRKIRVAACEALHSLILLLIGRTAQQTNAMRQQRPMTALYGCIFPVAIALAADGDVVVRNLFDSLINQVWLAVWLHS